MAVTVTEMAVNQLNSMMKEQEIEGQHLRIGINSGGCSGLEYFIAFDADIKETDAIVEQNGIKVLVDKESLALLDGAKLDYSNDMMNSGFTFTNPNASSSCGCGKSFCA